MPSVSVLLPVRNARATLPACLRSLARQTLRDHEVIVVDDGSSDGSGELLAAAARRDPRLRVITTPRRGLVPALNAALAAARARLVARMDADDVSHADRLRVQARRLATDPGTDILGCRVRLRSSPDQPNAGMRAYVRWQNRLLRPEAIVRDLFVESPLAHPSVMMRKSVLRALGGYREFDGPEDYDLWLRAHEAGYRFAKLRQAFLTWCDAPGRLSRVDSRYAPERFRALKIEVLARGPLAGGRRVVIWGAGPIGKAWARALLAGSHRLVAFVEVDRRKIGQRIHGAAVVDLATGAGLRGPLHLAAVGQPGARARIRREAARRGLVEGRDFLAVA